LLVAFTVAPPVLPVHNIQLVDSFSSPWIRQDFLYAQKVGGPDEIFIALSNLTLLNNGSDTAISFYAFPPTYTTLDAEGNAIRELATSGTGFFKGQYTLPDNNLVEYREYVGYAGNCSVEVFFEIFKNPENVTFAGEGIPLSQGAWKMYLALENCTFHFGEEESLLFYLEIILEGAATNYTKYTDSRGSLTRISWFLEDSGRLLRWDWIWPQLAIIDNGTIVELFVDFQTNSTSETSHVSYKLPIFTSAEYDPNINIVLMPDVTRPNGVGDGTVTSVVVGVIVPVFIGTAFLIIVVVSVVGVTTVIIIRKRRRSKIQSKLNFLSAELNKQ